MGWVWAGLFCLQVTYTSRLWLCRSWFIDVWIECQSQNSSWWLVSARTPAVISQGRSRLLKSGLAVQCRSAVVREGWAMTLKGKEYWNKFSWRKKWSGLNFCIQNLRPSNIEVIFQRPSCGSPIAVALGFIAGTAPVVWIWHRGIQCILKLTCRGTSLNWGRTVISVTAWCVAAVWRVVRVEREVPACWVTLLVSRRWSACRTVHCSPTWLTGHTGTSCSDQRSETSKISYRNMAEFISARLSVDTSSVCRSTVKPSARLTWIKINVKKCFLAVIIPAKARDYGITGVGLSVCFFLLPR